MYRREYIIKKLHQAQDNYDKACDKFYMYNNTGHKYKAKFYEQAMRKYDEETKKWINEIEGGTIL